MSIRNEEQENSYEMHAVRDGFGTKFLRGSFLYYVLSGFEMADPSNFELMRPLVRALIKKYALECAGARCTEPWTAPLPAWVTEA